jgi:hypothetical protein
VRWACQETFKCDAGNLHSMSMSVVCRDCLTPALWCSPLGCAGGSGLSVGDACGSGRAGSCCLGCLGAAAGGNLGEDLGTNKGDGDGGLGGGWSNLQLLPFCQPQ